MFSICIRSAERKHHVIIETHWAQNGWETEPADLLHQRALCFSCKIICAGKRKLKYIVEPWFYFAWSNLIDGEHVPQAPLRSEKPPGSYI